MKEIKLTQGKVALVDDSDFEILNKYKWCLLKGYNTFYAQRRIGVKEPGTRRYIMMHTAIMGELPKGYEIDHKDGNGFNNQRDNLRLVTRRQNMQNRRQLKSSQYPGVHWDKKSARWHSVIQIGSYLSEEEAFDAYRHAVESIGQTVVGTK